MAAPFTFDFRYRTSAAGWQFVDSTYTTGDSVDGGLASFTTKSGTWRVDQSGEGFLIAFASAGYPYRTPFVGTMLRDPQKPPSGLQYEYKINPQEVTDEIYSVNPDPAWKYDAAHLTNGGVPMYLRAKKGESLGNELLDRVANHLVTRVLYLGGAAGVDGRRDLRGSALPIGPCVVNEQYGNLEAGPLPFTDRNGWVEWIEQLDIMTAEGLQPPTDSFNNANAHTVVQIGFILDAAKQMVTLGRIAEIADLDAAIAAMDLARQNTEEGQMRFRLWSKHMATPTVIEN